MKKKILALLMTAAMTMSLAACGGATDSSSADSSQGTSGDVKS
jgi:uncharacterized protein YdeI (BOF family)